MKKKETCLDDLIDNEQLMLLTGEVFDQTKKTFKFKYVAATILIFLGLVGSLNFNTVYAKVSEVFVHIFGQGIERADYFKDYWVLKEPVTFQLENGGEGIIEAAYKNKDEVTVVVTAPDRAVWTSKENKLLIGDKAYESTRFEMGVIYPQAFDGDFDKVNYKIEYGFLYNKEEAEDQEMYLKIANQKIPLEFILPVEMSGMEVDKVQLKGFEMYVMSLSQTNDSVAIAIKPKNQRLEDYAIYLHDPVLIDENGKEYRIDYLSQSRNELKCYEPIEGKFVGFKSGGICYRTKMKGHYNKEDPVTFPKVKIPLPKMNEKVALNKEIEIEGIKILIKEVELTSAGISITYASREQGAILSSIDMHPTQLTFECVGNTLGSNEYRITGDFSAYTGQEIEMDVSEVEMRIKQAVEYHFED